MSQSVARARRWTEKAPLLKAALQVISDFLLGI